MAMATAMAMDTDMVMEKKSSKKEEGVDVCILRLNVLLIFVYHY